MNRIKTTAILITVISLIQLFAPALLASDASYEITPEQGSVVLTPSVEDAVPSGNLLTYGSFDSSDCMTYIASEGSNVTRVTDANGGYIRVSHIPQSHIGAVYTPESTVSSGNYLFTGYFRTLRMGELTELRIIFRQANGENKIAYVYPTNDWLKVECYIELEDTLNSIKVCGGAASNMKQDYCFDHFSLVPVENVPSGSPTVFGTKVTSAEV
ncbi:MAG: hypothetical protein IJ261_01715, partial [Clostridia bacterium]|nr:hypothetical protein [Clostridia bacterium]